MTVAYSTLERQFGALSRDFRALRQNEAAAAAPKRSALQLASDLGIRLDGWQREAVTTGAHNLLLLVSRQGGKGSVATLLALDKALNDAGTTTVVVSRSERQARRLFRRIRRAYRSLSDVPPAIVSTTTELELMNGSEVLALPGSEETIRGVEGVHLLIVDEASLVPDELMGAVSPFLATTDGRTVLLSTPRGKRGFFYRQWLDDSPDWHKVKVTAPEIARIKPSFLERERRSMGDWLYRQEYECQFLDSDSQLYATELVMGALSAAVAPLGLPTLGGSA